MKKKLYGSPNICIELGSLNTVSYRFLETIRKQEKYSGFKSDSSLASIKETR